MFSFLNSIIFIASFFGFYYVHKYRKLEHNRESGRLLKLYKGNTALAKGYRLLRDG